MKKKKIYLTTKPTTTTNNKYYTQLYSFDVSKYQTAHFVYNYYINTFVYVLRIGILFFYVCWCVTCVTKHDYERALAREWRDREEFVDLAHRQRATWQIVSQ